MRRGADEVHLAAYAAEGQAADGVRADLAGEVDLYGRVHRHHAVLLIAAAVVVHILGSRVRMKDQRLDARPHQVAEHGRDIE